MFLYFYVLLFSCFHSAYKIQTRWLHVRPHPCRCSGWAERAVPAPPRLPPSTASTEQWDLCDRLLAVGSSWWDLCGWVLWCSCGALLSPIESPASSRVTRSSGRQPTILSVFSKGSVSPSSSHPPQLMGFQGRRVGIAVRDLCPPMWNTVG